MLFSQASRVCCRYRVIEPHEVNDLQRLGGRCGPGAEHQKKSQGFSAGLSRDVDVHYWTRREVEHQPRGDEQ